MTRSSFNFVSATVPKFTLADEEREISTLTPEEKRVIVNDLNGHENNDDNPALDGSSSNNDSTPSSPTPPTSQSWVTREELDNFEFELSKIPLSDKAAYERALFECPRLIEKESNPQRFLLYENHNAERAAIKMAKYWEMRETIFGDKAFLPMTLEGALSDDFQTMLTCPNFCRLVFDAEDRGRTILFGNTEGVDLNNLPRGTMLRILWYNAHLAMKRLEEQQEMQEQEHPPGSNSRGHGIVVVNFGRRLTLDQFDRRRNRMIVKSIAEYLPIQVQAVHLVTCSLFLETVLPVVKWYMGRRLRLRIRTHQGPDKEVLQKLTSFGVNLLECTELLDPRHYESAVWVSNQLQKERREQDASGDGSS